MLELSAVFGKQIWTYLNKVGKQKWLNAVDEASAEDDGDIENSVSVYYGSLSERYRTDF